MSTSIGRSAAHATVSLLLLSASSAALAQAAPIVQPGAPGEASRTLSAQEATTLASASYTPADVAFMQGMIGHHQQAVDMAELIKDRTNREELVAIGGRIESSQADEIEFMNGWLSERGEKTVMVGMAGMDHSSMDHSQHAMVDHSTMAGMATPEQMAELATLSGVDFDRMFLILMIAHHEGAITMVDDLLGQPGTAADPVLFQFVSDIENDQQAEIDKMTALLAELSPDPRAGLTSGFADAGEAILNLRKVVSLSKPAGFFNPDNPADLRPAIPSDEEVEDEAETEEAEEGDDAEAPER